MQSSCFSARLWERHINQRVSGGRRGAQREARAGVGCKRPHKLIEERAASSSRYTRRPPQCTPPSSSHRKRLPKTGGAASHLVVQSPLSSSETAASPGPSSRGQAHLVWDRTAKVVSMVLRCSGHWVTRPPWSTLSSGALWALVRAGEVSVGCCHSKEEGRSPEIEANSGSRMITCRSGSVVASRDKKSSIEGQRLR